MPASIERVMFAQQEYRTVSLTDAPTLTKHPLAMDLDYNTLIASEAEAIAFGNYILGLRKLDRWTWSCFVNKQNYAVEVGQTITIQYPRFGLDAGKNFIVKRVKRDSKSVYDELTLFGPE